MSLRDYTRNVIVPASAECPADVIRIPRDLGPAQHRWVVISPSEGAGLIRQAGCGK